MRSIMYFLCLSTLCINSYANEKLIDVLKEDFEQFVLTPEKPLSNDEVFFRSLCFISAALWALRLGGPEETFENYAIYFAAFSAFGPLVAYFNYKYFKQTPSISRQIFNSLFFLALRKHAALKADHDLPFYIYIPQNY